MSEARLVPIRPLLAPLAGVLLALSVSACAHGGSASSSTSSTTSGSGFGSTTSSVIPAGQTLRGDGDADNPSDIDGNGDSDGASVGGADSDNDNPTTASYKFPDADDRATFAYGHTPSAVEQRTISDAVKRYYAAASTGDGAAACALLPTSLARSLPEEVGSARHSTCQAIVSTSFRQRHQQLAEAITVVAVRIKGNSAQVVFSSRSMPASDIYLTREARSWKVEQLLGQPLP